MSYKRRQGIESLACYRKKIVEFFTLRSLVFIFEGREVDRKGNMMLMMGETESQGTVARMQLLIAWMIMMFLDGVKEIKLGVEIHRKRSRCKAIRKSIMVVMDKGMVLKE